mmetsp:Transcript_1809/g.2117  ORF Transcript_1809/g.2117 Transcript_1809/m.2117 type:complete len:202 (-) Transcript_1809:534-1139(-)|eukprot:CAMPEP_0184029242 /NCGR_PEP_ID=MMETSP0955-20130417/230_1 /TAXON_ID=627963 /ORGANISM="Aplanochytrium sp, Strain PBS07" /LENGTH=201 /DNA_ID=CAMNT_0026314243 /DNA_START=286 /DNA_END=891 /DNA_ORIENTATION=+
MDFVKALQMWGVKGTFRHLYMFKRIKIGRCVGVDALGNKYFENTDYPMGQHRWIEHKDFNGHALAEASTVHPLWHGWLHCMTDQVPQDNKINTSLTGKQIASGDHTPVSDHYNTEHLRQWRPNPTMKRERGYGVGSPVSEPGENGFYTQRGHPMNPFHELESNEIESWDAQPATSVASANEADETWQKFYKIRQKMNQSKN